LCTIFTNKLSCVVPSPCWQQLVKQLVDLLSPFCVFAIFVIFQLMELKLLREKRSERAPSQVYGNPIG